MTEKAFIPNEQKIQVIKLHREGYKKFEIMKKVGLTKYHVNKILNPEDHTRILIDKKARYKKDPQYFSAKSTKNNNLNPIYDPIRDGKLWHSTMDAYLTGDPLPGRSALDQLKQK